MWRYAGQSRYLVSSIANFLFVLAVQIQTIHHLNLRRNILQNTKNIDVMLEIARNPEDFKSYYNDPEFKTQMSAIDDALY